MFKKQSTLKPNVRATGMAKTLMSFQVAAMALTACSLRDPLTSTPMVGIGCIESFCFKVVERPDPNRGQIVKSTSVVGTGRISRAAITAWQADLPVNETETGTVLFTATVTAKFKDLSPNKLEYQLELEQSYSGQTETETRVFDSLLQIQEELTSYGANVEEITWEPIEAYTEGSTMPLLTDIVHMSVVGNNQPGREGEINLTVQSALGQIIKAASVKQNTEDAEGNKTTNNQRYVVDSALTPVANAIKSAMVQLQLAQDDDMAAFLTHVPEPVKAKSVDELEKQTDQQLKNLEAKTKLEQDLENADLSLDGAPSVATEQLDLTKVTG